MLLSTLIDMIQIMHNKNPSQTCTRSKVKLLFLLRVETRYFAGHKKASIPAFYSHLSPS